MASTRPAPINVLDDALTDALAAYPAADAAVQEQLEKHIAGILAVAEARRKRAEVSNQIRSVSDAIVKLGFVLTDEQKRAIAEIKAIYQSDEERAAARKAGLR